MRKTTCRRREKLGVYGLNRKPSALLKQHNLKQRTALDMADASEPAVTRPRLPQGTDGGEGGAAGLATAPLLLRPRPPPPPLTEQEIVKPPPLPPSTKPSQQLLICAFTLLVLFPSRLQSNSPRSSVFEQSLKRQARHSPRQHHNQNPKPLMVSLNN
jgi:hypothetical protein